ncbi:hypothetical protein D3C81_2201790 [compost metagenome]
MLLLFTRFQRHHEALYLDFLIVQRGNILAELGQDAIFYFYLFDLGQRAPRSYALDVV